MTPRTAIFAIVLTAAAAASAQAAPLGLTGVTPDMLTAAAPTKPKFQHPGRIKNVCPTGQILITNVNTGRPECALIEDVLHH